MHLSLQHSSQQKLSKITNNNKPLETTQKELRLLQMEYLKQKPMHQSSFHWSGSVFRYMPSWTNRSPLPTINYTLTIAKKCERFSLKTIRKELNQMGLQSAEHEKHKWQMCLLHISHSVNESNCSETDSEANSNTNMVHNSHLNNYYKLAHLVAISLH